MFLGKGDGTLFPSVEYEAIGGVVVTADVDGDGRCDLIGATSNVISVLMNRSAWPE